MKHKKQALISIMLTAVILILSASPVLAADIQAAYAKMPDDLLAEFDKIGNSESINVFAWIEDESTAEYEAITANIPEPEFAQNNEPSTYSLQSVSANNELTEEERMAQIEEMQNYIMQKRQIAQAVYLEDNTAKAAEIAENLSGGEIVYVSKYSPLIIYNVTKSQAVELAMSDCVLGLDRGNVEVEDYSVTASAAVGVTTMQNYGYTGQGVKIGMIEEGTPMVDDWICFDGLSNRIILKQDAIANSLHATYVAALLIGNNDGIVKGFEKLYCASSETPSKIIINAEWMLDNGVNVINFSCGTTTSGEYNIYTKWIEHIVYQHNVHCVAATGNDGENQVGVYAMAYNVISVGAIDDRGTSAINDDTIMHVDNTGEHSAYNSSGTTYANKPDLCAPGVNVGITAGVSSVDKSGTSIAAPYVTGAVAMLCSQSATLLNKPALVKSILCTSVSKKTSHNYKTSDSGYAEYGSGILNVLNARLVAQGSYVNSTINSNQMLTFNIGQCSAGNTITITLCYLRGVGNPAGEHTILPSTSAENLSNLDIYILPISATSTSLSIASSTSTNNNVEKIICQIPTTGEYKIVVHRKTDTVNNTVRFAASWQRHASTLQ